jgi:hypothetical protein
MALPACKGRWMSSAKWPRTSKACAWSAAAASESRKGSMGIAVARMMQPASGGQSRARSMPAAPAGTLMSWCDPAYGEAIAELKKEGLLPKETRHRQVKYLNNRLEGDHGKLKRLIKPTLGFQSMKTAYATLKGFEVMRMFRKGQFRLWIEAIGGGTEASFVNRLFGVYA